MAQSTLANWSLKVLGFVLGFALAVALEFVLVWLVSEVFGYRFYPRGLGWIVIPFSSGLGGAALLSTLRHDQIARLFGGSREVRMYVAAGVSWCLLVLGYVYLARPFGYYSIDWEVVFKWLLVPPGLALIVRTLFRWASKKDEPRLADAVSPPPSQPIAFSDATTVEVSSRAQETQSEERVDPEQAKTDLAELSRRISQVKGAAG